MSQLSGTLFTGLSGLVTSQAELNVVGNNIANANTTAFKSSRVMFTPQFYVTDQSGSPSTGSFGGTNPSQVGLGSQVAAVQQNFSQGQLQATGVASDLGINGNGFFVIKNASSQQLYTRDGAFTVNDQNQLVDASGDFVMGYGVDSQFQIVPGALQPISIPLGQETVAKATQNASLTGVLNAGGTVASSGSNLTSQALQAAGGGAVTAATLLTNLQDYNTATSVFSSGDVLTLNGKLDGTALPSQTFTVTAASTVGDLQSFLSDGLAIDTTPPTGTAGTSIVNDPNGGQDLLVSGNLGSTNAISISNGGLTNSSGSTLLSFAPSSTLPSATGESANTTITAYDSLGNPITLNVNTVLASQSATGTTWQFYVSSPNNIGASPFLSAGTLTFNTSGQLTGSTGTTVTVNRTGTGATPTQQIALNFGGVQSLAEGTTASNLVSESQDGFAIGTLDSYAIGTDGIITGSFSNGLTETIGQVALANFNNASGLVNQGNNQYAAGADSGAAIITTPGNEGAGTIQSGTLEQSNVDLSQEFINLIIASTGYSASSRVISTSDQLLTELLNSQR